MCIRSVTELGIHFCVRNLPCANANIIIPATCFADCARGFRINETGKKLGVTGCKIPSFFAVSRKGKSGGTVCHIVPKNAVNVPSGEGGIVHALDLAIMAHSVSLSTYLNAILDEIGKISKLISMRAPFDDLTLVSLASAKRTTWDLVALAWHPCRQRTSGLTVRQVSIRPRIVKCVPCSD